MKESSENSVPSRMAPLTRGRNHQQHFRFANVNLLIIFEDLRSHVRIVLTIFISGMLHFFGVRARRLSFSTPAHT